MLRKILKNSEPPLILNDFFFLPETQFWKLQAKQAALLHYKNKAKQNKPTKKTNKQTNKYKEQ